MTRSWPSCARLPGAPDGLRERVRALPEPQPRFAWTLPRIDVRRVVLVPCRRSSRSAVGAAALNGVLAGRDEGAAAARAGEQRHNGRGAEHLARGQKASACGSDAGQAVRFLPRARRAAPRSRRATTRLNKYNAWLRVRVDADGLSRDDARDADRARLRRLRRVGRHEHAGTARHSVARPARSGDEGRGRRPAPRQARRGHGAARADPGSAAPGERPGAARSCSSSTTIAGSSASSRASLSAGRALQLQYQLDEAKAVARAEDEGAREHRSRGNARHGLDDVRRPQAAAVASRTSRATSSARSATPATSSCSSWRGCSTR